MFCFIVDFIVIFLVQMMGFNALGEVHHSS